MAEPAVFTVEDARIILETVRQVRASGILQQSARRAAIESQRGLYFTNVSGEEIPAWACMQITGTEEIGGQNFLQADQPADNDGSAGWFVFNGPFPVADGNEGYAQVGPVYRGYKSSGTVTGGDKWQPVASQWYIEQDNAGIFICAGADDIDDDVLKVFQPSGSGGGSSQSFFITPSGGIAACTESSGAYTPGSATCDQAEWDGTDIEDNGTNATVYNISDQAIAGSVLIKAAKVDGIWVVDVAGCGS